MDIVSQVKTALEECFRDSAEEANQQTHAVKRVRKFTPVSLAMTFVLGFLNRNRATVADLAGSAALADVDVSPQAIEKRFTPELAGFLEHLFRSATKKIVASSQTLAPILERFTQVTLIDSSTLVLPTSQQERFRGTGGKNGSGKAALKLQTELDLRSGALGVEIEQGKDPDGASLRQHIAWIPESLRIADLGYFNIAVFAAIAAAKAFFLSRIQHTTIVWIHNERMGNIVSWLNQQAEPRVDCWIEIGAKERLGCRLIAWKVPPEQVNRRRRRARTEAVRRGRQVTAATLAACEWTFMITNVGEDRLSTEEVIILYRSRWQIELLFKRWKSIGLIAELSGKNDTVQMVRLWAKLCAALIQHWLTVMVAWNSESSFSLDRIAKRTREIADALIGALAAEGDVIPVLDRFKKTVKRTCRRDIRSKPGTIELLRNPKKLDYSLS